MEKMNEGIDRKESEGERERGGESIATKQDVNAF